MSDNSKENDPFRIRIKHGLTNFIQKYRSALLGLVIAIVVVFGALAIWSQIDSAVKKDYAAKIEKSQEDFSAWEAETDSVKKAELGKALEDELAVIEAKAPVSIGLLKAWFIHGNYWSSQGKWSEAANAYRTVFDKDPRSYLAPIALNNAAVAWEEAGDLAKAISTYELFLKDFSKNAILGPQVYFSQGQILEKLNKKAEALTSYQTLASTHPESNWTKLGRDRIILLGTD